mmetsp:Transcript_11745/g.26978  ORF Transcript_11745/g.26978 Transcript_11745/m.26978 type:complete len:844 (-) Transcript_11745:27-2558(-)
MIRMEKFGGLQVRQIQRDVLQKAPNKLNILKPLPRTSLREALADSYFHHFRMTTPLTNSFVERVTFIEKLLDPDDEDLEHVFNEWDKDRNGSISLDEMQGALERLNINYNRAEIEDFFNAMDVNNDGSISLQEFKRAVNTPCALERWVLALPISRLIASVLPKGDANNPLTGLLALDREGFKQICDQLHPMLLQLFMARRNRLTQALEKMKTSKKQKGTESESKFSIYSLEKGKSCGTIEDFKKGIQSRVGYPHDNIYEGMRREHCEMKDSPTKFRTTNYEIETCPEHEWKLVTDLTYQKKEKPKVTARSKDRKLVSVDELMKRDCVARAKLSKDEVVAVNLYSGPMFYVYNTVLRRSPPDFYEQLQGNCYPSTIHALVSALIKLQSAMDIPEGLTLYRGLGHSALPAGFYGEDGGVKGFTELGFMSTTTDKDVAIEYSKMKEGNPLATVLSMQCGAVDRAANIQELSQYPREKEYLWVPLSYIEPQGDQHILVSIDGAVTVIPVRTNSNLKAETVEEIEKRRKDMCMAAYNFNKQDLHIKLSQLSSSTKFEQRNIDVLDKGSKNLVIESIKANYEQLGQRIEEKESTAFHRDENYRAIFTEIIETKSWAVEKLEYFLEDIKEFSTNVAKWSLRDAHRKLMFKLQKEVRAVVDQQQIKSSAFRLCQIRGSMILNLEERNELEETPLIEAAADGRLSDLELLIKAGAKLDARTKDGTTALMKAAEYEHANCLEALIDANADLELKQKETEHTALTLAARRGNRLSMELLLEKKADASVQLAKGGYTAATFVCRYDYSDCLAVLVAKRAPLDLPLSTGWTALMVASYFGSSGKQTLTLFSFAEDD